MSADMMIVCKEYKNDWAAGDIEKMMQRRDDPCYVEPYQIDETSMGEPWTEFGKWFGQRFCKAPGILDQLHGLKEHRWAVFTQPDYTAVLEALKTMDHTIENEREFQEYMLKLIGKHISTENW